MPRTLIVIPCFNEAERLPSDEIAAFADANSNVGFLMVNDGSTDETLRALDKLAKQRPKQIRVLDLEHNVGKAEAVRRGMVMAFETDATYCGYMDADLATPLSEIERFEAELDAHLQCDLILGSRVQLLGRRIRRNPWRHYLGRVFATAASLCLELPVYDTQCGAKMFRNGALTRGLFAEPFETNWVFDVEILARLISSHRGGLSGSADQLVRELPLLEWTDVAGSKLGAMDFLTAIVELLRIRNRYLRGARATDRT